MAATQCGSNEAFWAPDSSGRQLDSEPGSGVTGGPTLGEISEQELLSSIFPQLPSNGDVLLGPGDDAALLRVGQGAAIITTDTMVLGRDWLDEWSSATDVGGKCVAQNLADVAAMGGRPTGVVVTLVAATDLPVSWAREFSAGVARACERAGVAVLGGDLSSAPQGVRTVSITALGEADGPVVRRSGAQVGDVVAVCGSLGMSAAGLILLQRGERSGPEVAWQRAPVAPYDQGPIAARSGASAMIDISDGLVRDAGRIAAASGVAIELSGDLLSPYADRLRDRVGDQSWECVLTGGEEHSLLACYPADTALPQGWSRIGVVRDADADGVPAGPAGLVTVDGRPQEHLGWDHFARE